MLVTSLETLRRQIDGGADSIQIRGRVLSKLLIDCGRDQDDVALLSDAAAEAGSRVTEVPAELAAMLDPAWTPTKGADDEPVG
ncbi:hypothetical protein [Roseiconus lacunae]|uniref:hypothetical protein n=1 Tax=Roseiconus lacunae TaxID=2605694 RepID=UPI001E516BC7|nr:hypothetical protein [Roseiconus lacunae]MCD0460061.1 hypothetical protein [Roseiconus lacunae]